MSPTAIPAVLVLAGGLLLAAIVVTREARRSGLGLAHPGVAWLGLHALFFGVGGAVLALTGDAAGQAVYAGAAAASFALGLGASAAVARARAPVSAAPAPSGSGPAPVGSGGPIADVRPAIAALLAVASVLLVTPILLRTGIPFFTDDITGARTQVAGLVVQPMRVALPALAVAALLWARRANARGTTPAGRTVAQRTIAIAVGTIAAIAAFELLLASRYFVAELAGALAIAWLMDGGRVSWRLGVAAVVIGVAVFAGVQVLRAWDQARGQELAFVLERTVNRVVLVQPRTLDAIMTAIPAEEPFLGGLGWLRRLGPLFGREVPNLGYWIYPRVVDGGQLVAGYAAPGLIGEAWANLGWAGLALFAVLGAGAERLAALARACPGQADRTAAVLLVLFVARTHALGLGGLAVVAVLVIGWRALAAPGGRLAGNLRGGISWRSLE